MRIVPDGRWRRMVPRRGPRDLSCRPGPDRALLRRDLPRNRPSCHWYQQVRCGPAGPRERSRCGSPPCTRDLYRGLGSEPVPSHRLQRGRISKWDRPARARLWSLLLTPLDHHVIDSQREYRHAHTEWMMLLVAGRRCCPELRVRKDTSTTPKAAVTRPPSVRTGLVSSSHIRWTVWLRGDVEPGSLSVLLVLWRTIRPRVEIVDGIRD